jgi:protein kinase-like protein
VSWVPRIGAEFAGYRLDGLLGHGGMSVVYRAEHVLLGRKVALKLLSPQLSEDEGFRERFTRESRLAASLDHPNIIPIYEAADSDGVFFIAMRYVEGADLRAILKQGPLDPQRLIPIIDQTANALAAAHARGLVHRDVKPANILIDPGEARGEQDHVYLSDFGVAKQIAAPGVTKAGIFVGTADYAAPEQIEGKELDARADIYSLGCLVYECLTGTSAYDKDSEVALMYAHLLEPPPHVSDRRPDLPPEVDDVVGKAMAKSRDDRYDGPKDFAAALRDALADVSVAAAQPTEAVPDTVLAPRLADVGATAAGGDAVASTTAGTQGTTASSSAPPPDSPPPGPARGGRKLPDRPVLIATAVAGALAIALVVSLAFLFTGGDNESSASPPGGTGTQTVSGGGPADTLLSVVTPSQIAKECTTASVPTQGAVETDNCVPPANAPTNVPNELQLDFYPNAQALEQAYQERQKGLTPAHCGATLGERVWFHPTGKRGGRRLCFNDPQGRFVVVWTHEKLGSDDHVDMLGDAREPGRAPTTFQSWWGSVNDFIGKCRPKGAEDTCLATIKKLSQ